jgi:hypothetical protein
MIVDFPHPGKPVKSVCLRFASWPNFQPPLTLYCKSRRASEPIEHRYLLKIDVKSRFAGGVKVETSFVVHYSRFDPICFSEKAADGKNQ